MITLLQIAGSLGLFLFGMRTMSNGMQRAAGDRLQAILSYMTGHRLTAVATGLLLTVLVQSSSASTVMVVSFVNASLLSLTQAVGVIMGANVGTTLTGWLVASVGLDVNVTAAALPAIGVGAVLVFSRKLRRTPHGEALIGFGIIFLGLSFLRDSVPDVSDYPQVLEYFTLFGGYGALSVLLFVLAGGVLTVLVQSSSAAIAITLTAAFAGWIDYPSAAAVILGENLGTTITANVAAVGGTLSARRAARAHLVFNAIGVFWMVAVFPLALALVDWIMPGSPYSIQGIHSALPAHLAMFHTLFNVTNTSLCIGFVPRLVRLVNRVVPGTDDEREIGSYRLPIVGEEVHQSPEFYLVEVRSEIAKLGALAEKMFARLHGVFVADEAEADRVVAILEREERFTDEMRDQLTEFLASFSMESLTKRGATDVAAMLRVVDELESVADSCFNLGLLAQRRARRKLQVDPQALRGLSEYFELVSSFLAFIREHLNERVTAEEFRAARALEERVDNERNRLKKAARKRLQGGGNVRTELLLIDMIAHLEHIGDYALNIAQSLAPPPARNSAGGAGKRRVRFGRGGHER